MAAEAGSGGPGRPGPRGGGPRARALWPPAVLRRSRLRSRLRRRKDGWHGGPGERALYPLRSRQLPAGRGEEEVNIPSRRVLVTGATGLLGRAVYKEFQQSNWHTIGCGFRRARPKFEQVNLLDSEAVHHLIHDFQDPSIKGTFHWSGNEQMTKYEMACAIADAFNLPSSHLRPITDSPVIGAQRPRNAQLDCSKLETLGIGQRTPFRIGIKESLWPFLIDKRWRQTVFH
ncbi:methionine adenosyltransferase II beta [Cricetulus griseus]